MQGYFRAIATSTVIAAGLLGWSAMAQDSTPQPTTAKTNASSSDVKALGERMVTDHTKANDQLKQIATSKGITLPTSLNAKDQATYDRLSKLNGAEFDAAYMKDMVAD